MTTGDVPISSAPKTRRSIRVTKLQWAAFIISVLWAVGAGFHTHNDDVDRAESFAKFAYKVCTDSKNLRHDSDLSSCGQDREQNLRSFMQGSNKNVLFAALVPIPVGWLAAFIILYVWRAQVIGFRAVIPWARLNWLKKIFVVLCSSAAVLLVAFGGITILNLYVDTLVPVGLSPLEPEVIKIGDTISVTGTWVRSGSLGKGSALADPLQTSLIRCTKGEPRCIEARAYVTGKTLQVDEVEHDIYNWNSNAIVLRDESLCASEVFTIDLNTNAVTGAGFPINQDNSYCKMYPVKETQWSYILSKGFPIYWQKRQAARPLPLRVFQSIFGN
jgi:hypothetical protein